MQDIDVNVQPLYTGNYEDSNSPIAASPLIQTRSQGLYCISMLVPNHSLYTIYNCDMV